MLDAIVIGGGPAGISAAVYIARGNLKVAVLYKDGGSLERAEAIENYYGLARPVTGAQLLENGLAQAKRLGVEVIAEEVTAIEKLEHFEVTTPTNHYTAKAVLLATGKRRAMPKISGLKELSGKGVSFCAVCDGFFYRGKRLALIGSGDYAAHELEALFAFTDQITVFTNGNPVSQLLESKNARLVTEPIQSLAGDGRVRAVIIGDGTEYEIDGVFVAQGTAGAADFARKLGVLTEGENIVVDEHFKTNIEGLYAAGDCIGGLLQIAKAVSDGAHAATRMISYCKKA